MKELWKRRGSIPVEMLKWISKELDDHPSTSFDLSKETIYPWFDQGSKMIYSENY